MIIWRRYTIPGENGTCAMGKRVINLAWYHNHPENDLSDILRDTDGYQHRFSLPYGKMREEVWNRQREIAASKIHSRPFLEIINKIKNPFLTVISDTYASQACFIGGKALLVGDALTLFRPHIAMSTDQAAFDCLRLKMVMKGEITIQNWEKDVLQYARAGRLRSITWGAYFQVGWLAFFRSEVNFRWEIVSQWFWNWF